MPGAVTFSLTGLSTALIVYASLFPFTGWRDQGVSVLAFLSAPLPRYWSAFDLGINIAGYFPFGFLTYFSFRKAGSKWGAGSAMVCAIAISALLSAMMEGLQTWLPSRIPSNVDWIMNIIGAAQGAAAAVAVEKQSVFATLERLCQRSITPARAGPLLLATTWPLALIYPLRLPFDLGRLPEGLVLWGMACLSDIPYGQNLISMNGMVNALTPWVEIIAVASGIVIPVLMAYVAVRPGQPRMVACVGTIGLGVGVTALSVGLWYGPSHAWSSFTAPAIVGVSLGAVTALAMMALSSTSAAVLCLGLLVLQIALINPVEHNAYYLQALQVWDQGRFARFYGLMQWIGWCWPYAAIVVLVNHLGTRKACR